MRTSKTVLNINDDKVFFFFIRDGYYGNVSNNSYDDYK